MGNPVTETCYGQTLTVTASGNWTAASSPWLLCQPISGTGNGIVTANLLDQGLPRDSFGRVKSGVYTGSVTVTPASGLPATVPVTYAVGYGDLLG